MSEERDMSAYIPEPDFDPADIERDMSAKTELGDGIHTTSGSFGEVVSDHATDAAGNTPKDIAGQAEARGVKTGTTGKKKK